MTSELTKNKSGVQMKLIRYFLYVLPVASVYQSYKGLSYGPLDMLMLLIAIYLILKTASKSLLLDKLGGTLILISIMGVITLVAYGITESSWYNIYRSILYSAVTYVGIINLDRALNKNSLLFSMVLISLFHLWLMLSNWGGGFSHFNLEQSYFNLNNIGILSLIIFLFSVSICCECDNINYLIIASIVLSVTCVVMSFSRANYLLLLLSLMFIFWKSSRYNGGGWLFLSALFFTPFLYFIKNISALEGGFAFLEKKVTVGTPFEIIKDRWLDVVYEPFDRYLEGREAINIFFGGAVFPEHSLIVTFVTCFGLFSMFLYMRSVFIMSSYISSQKMSLSILSLLSIVVFLNDASTNASSYVLPIKLIPFLAFGVLFGYPNERLKRVKF